MPLQNSRRVMLAGLLSIAMAGCVDVTKPTGVSYSPTSADKIELLVDKPTQPYKVVAKISANSWWTFQADAMHEAMKKKAAAAGADALLIEAEGVRTIGLGSYERYAQADAIKFTPAPTAP